MALSTFSKFYYLSTPINSNNNALNFNEGGGELLATINSGSYTLEQLMLAVKTAMDTAGTQEYTVSLDRDSRLVTISAGSAFDLLISSGTQLSVSIFSLLGFNGADLTGLTTYTGGSAIGSVYFPQFWLQDFTSPDDFQERIDPAVNESASGEIEVISFGVRKFLECNIIWITDIPQDGKTVKNNPTGHAAARSFMQFITTRAPLEIMIDESDSDAFLTIQLDRTPKSAKGTGYLLQEETGKNLPGYYRTGKLQFRVKE